MRSRLVLLSLLTTGVVTVGFVFAATSGGQEANHLAVTVNKVVDGTAPSAAHFTVHWECAGTDTSGDIVFDATGTPSGTNVISPGPGTTSCTVTETETGSATSVAYACTHQSDATCDNDHTVSGGGPNGDATITVTNTFVPAAATAAARFTG